LKVVTKGGTSAQAATLIFADFSRRRLCGGRLVPGAPTNLLKNKSISRSAQNGPRLKFRIRLGTLLTTRGLRSARLCICLRSQVQILPTKPTRYEKAWQVQITRNQLAVIAYARNPEERESVADSIALVPMAEQNLRLKIGFEEDTPHLISNRNSAVSLGTSNSALPCGELRCTQPRHIRPCCRNRNADQSSPDRSERICLSSL
jgi:hypothetical protein